MARKKKLALRKYNGRPPQKNFCICNGPSAGTMIACDDDKCAIQWFHLDCVGLASAPSGDWFCSSCADPQIPMVNPDLPEQNSDFTHNAELPKPPSPTYVLDYISQLQGKQKIVDPPAYAKPESQLGRGNRIRKPSLKIREVCETPLKDIHEDMQSTQTVHHASHMLTPTTITSTELIESTTPTTITSTEQIQPIVDLADEQSSAPLRRGSRIRKPSQKIIDSAETPTRKRNPDESTSKSPKRLRANHSRRTDHDTAEQSDPTLSTINNLCRTNHDTTEVTDSQQGTNNSCRTDHDTISSDTEPETIEVVAFKTPSRDSLLTPRTPGRPRIRTPRIVGKKRVDFDAMSNKGFNYTTDYDYTMGANIGQMNVECKHCGALKFSLEPDGMCCKSGKVQLTPLHETPEPLRSLLQGNHFHSAHFKRLIRTYNSAFQMTSFGYSNKNSADGNEGNDWKTTFKVIASNSALCRFFREWCRHITFRALVPLNSAL